METGAFFICLKVERPSCIPRPVSDETSTIIVLARFHSASGTFRGVYLPGESIMRSSDDYQIFERGN